MKIDWLSRYSAFAGNVAEPFTGMLPYLGEKLGVSAQSLADLGVCFAPIVSFKKRESSCWWVTPERNPEGGIIGFALRGESGAKVMYPGSKHGLVYAIRPGYKTGEKNYTPGRHNWCRTMDAGQLCPVCGKPDGCLLSAENPADPKAVMCMRESKGAARPGNVDTGGWLHIRKPEGHIAKGGPIAESEFPIVLVEGMSDAAAARDFGMESVGRPSNLAGLGHLRDLVKGRSCVIVGENDIAYRNDGTPYYPGQQGVEAAFETLKNCCKIVKVFPPEGIKDLRQWKNEQSLTRDAFLKYIETNGSSQGDDRTLDSKEPVKVAMRWLREEHTMDGVPVLRQYEGEWYRFDGTRYEKIEEDAYIRGGLYRWLLDRNYRSPLAEGGVELLPYEADKGKLTNVIDALLMDCPLKAEPPCWLDGRTEPSPTNLIAFPNGVLNVADYLSTGNVELLPLSPLYFTFNALPYDFDPRASCLLFERFLREIFPDDPKKLLLLQEWCGYLLLPDTTQQKLMVFNGTSGSGKGTVLYAMEAMLGRNQVCSPTLTGLGMPYGLAQMIGKLAAFIKDARLDNSAHKYVIMERLLELTGSVHPTLEVRRMHIAETTMHLFTRITLACNDLPDLPDSGGALPRRTLALHFTEKFDTETKQPNRQLPDQLAAEAPGILLWALLGLDRLRRQGYFTIPASSEELAKKFSANASPVSQFIDACCEVGSHVNVQEDVLYEAWKNWAREHGLSGGMRLKFSHNLMLTVSSIRHIKDVVGGQAIGGYTGIALTKAARERYLMK